MCNVNCEVKSTTAYHLLLIFINSICAGDISLMDDLLNLYYSISQIFAGWVQYQRYGSLDAVCDQIVAGQSTPLGTLAAVIVEYLSGQCLDVDTSAAYEHYSNTEYTDDISNKDLNFI